MENKRDIQKEKDVFHLKTLSKTNFGVMRWWASFSLLLGLLFHSSNPSKDFYCSACLETANLRRRRHQTKMINEKKTDIKQSNAESSMQRHQIHLDWLSLHCSSHTFCLLLRFHQDFIRTSSGDQFSTFLFNFLLSRQDRQNIFCDCPCTSFFLRSRSICKVVLSTCLFFLQSFTLRNAVYTTRMNRLPHQEIAVIRLSRQKKKRNLILCLFQERMRSISSLIYDCPWNCKCSSVIKARAMHETSSLSSSGWVTSIAS